MGLARNEEAAKTRGHDDMDHENLLNKQFYNILYRFESAEESFFNIGLKDVSRSNTRA